MVYTIWSVHRLSAGVYSTTTLIESIAQGGVVERMVNKDSHSWSADWTNDPDRGFDLYLELLEGDEYRGRIFRDDDGNMVLLLYGPNNLTIPLAWLRGLIDDAERDL